VYEVEILRTALKELRRINRQDQQRIAKVIDGLSEDPRPAASKKLTGSEDWRIRVGAYRIVYRIQDQPLLVLVLRIAHRRDVYRRG
jgi:mRNA interferase RelE/StbE